MYVLCQFLCSCMAPVSSMAQRVALLERYRAVLEAPRCDLLRLGVERCFLQFGPVVVSQEYVLLLAVVTDGRGRVRALDRLRDGDGPPHLTLGSLDRRGARACELHSRRVLWDIFVEPTEDSNGDLVWSREVAEVVDVTSLVDRMSEDVGLLGGAARGPLEADIFFDEYSRFVLVGGEALRLYRRVQAAIARDL